MTMSSGQKTPPRPHVQGRAAAHASQRSRSGFSIAGFRTALAVALASVLVYLAVSSRSTPPAAPEKTYPHVVLNNVWSPEVGFGGGAGFGLD